MSSKNFYRLTRKDEDIFTWNSVLCIESEQGLAACHEVLKEFSMIATLRDGHFGYGVYAQGVFCCSSIDDLKTMFADSPRRKDENNCVFVLEGEVISREIDDLNCVKSFVVKPTAIVRKEEISILKSFLEF